MAVIFPENVGTFAIKVLDAGLRITELLGVVIDFFINPVIFGLLSIVTSDHLPLEFHGKSRTFHATDIFGSGFTDKLHHFLTIMPDLLIHLIYKSLDTLIFEQVQVLVLFFAY